MGTFGVLKRFTAALLFVSVVGAAGAPVTWPSSASATSGGSVVLYEPQIRSLANQTQLNGLVALAVTLPGTSAPVYGALTFSSLASADQRAGTMTLVNPSVTATNWPKAKPADVPALDAFVKANVNLQGRTLPLSTVSANLGVKPPTYHGAPLNTTPPESSSVKPASVAARGIRR